MNTISPSKNEQAIANESFNQLLDSIDQLKTETPEIEIEEAGEKITIPLNALRLLADILGKMKEGKAFSLVPVATEMTTQAAAEFLNCSRPHVVKLLETDQIPFTKVGRHRRIKFLDLEEFKSGMKATAKSKLIEMMQESEQMGLYDS